MKIFKKFYFWLPVIYLFTLLLIYATNEFIKISNSPLIHPLDLPPTRLVSMAFSIKSILNTCIITMAIPIMLFDGFLLKPVFELFSFRLFMNYDIFIFLQLAILWFSVGLLIDKILHKFKKKNA